MNQRLLAAAVAVSVWSVAGSTSASYRPPPGDLSPSWSPDGGGVGYTSFREPSGLHVRYVADGLDRLYDETRVQLGGTSLSPDWRFVATVEPTGPPPAASALTVERLDGSDRRVLGDAIYSAVAWSPESSWIAFDRGPSLPGTLYTVALDGTGLTKVADDANNPAWSPDGTRISYEQRGTLVIAHADGPGSEFLVSEPANSPPQWAPDGSAIAVTVWRGNRWNVDVVDAATGDIRSFPADIAANEESVLSWAPDSRMVLYSIEVHTAQDATPGVRSLDVRTGEQKTIIASGGDAHYSPDGSKITFVAVGDCPSSGIYVANADGSNARRLTNDCHKPPPPPEVYIAPRTAAYGQTVRLSGWFPPGSATSSVRLIDFGSRSCTPTSATTRTVVTSSGGRWSYRFRPCKNGNLNIYSDTSETGAAVRVKPYLHLDRLAGHSYEATVRAGAPLRGSTLLVEVQRGKIWVSVRKLILIQPGYTATRTFVFHSHKRAKLRVELPNPIVKLANPNETIVGAYARATSNVVVTPAR